MRVRVILFLVLVVTIQLYAGGTITLNRADEPAQLNISQQTSEELDISVNINSLQYREVNTPQGRFTVLEIPGYHHTQTFGEPQLPLLNQLIEIPMGSNLQFDIEILNYDEQIISLSDYGIEAPLYPAQPPLSKSVDPSTVPFRFKQDVYQKDEYYGKEITTVEIRGIARYVRLALLSVAPISYNPVTGKLKIINNVQIRIRFINPDLSLTETLRSQYFSPYFESVLSEIPNHQVADLRDDLTRYPVKYVIVADPMFEEQLQPFIQWKRDKGFTVIEAYTDDPEVGNTTSSIQSYLHDLYNAGTPDDPAPTFVLFVGDEDQIPAFNGTQGSHVTDLYYCAVTGDMIPDMYYGRFSAENPSDLQPQIDKTLEMEMWTADDEAFMGRAMLIAGWDSYHTTDWGWPQVNYGTENYFNTDHNFTNVYPYLTTGSQQHVQEIINHVSEGLTFVNYTAHGSETSWADPSFTKSDINSLTNSDMYPTIVGNCCLTNAFDYYTACFGEAWLRAENKGAVGYIGGTNSTYWDEDLWWAVGYHTIQHGAGGAAPDYDDTGMGAFDANFVFDYDTQGSLVLAGNLAVEESGSSMRNYYWEIYTLMGDPSFMTYMGLPEINQVSLPIMIPVGVNSIIVDADPGSYIALSRDGIMHGVFLKTDNGPVTMDIQPFTTPGEAKFVITRQNRLPVVQNVPVIVPAVVTITPQNLQLNQQDTIRVSVLDEDGVLPLEGVHVWVSGWSVDSTDNQGFTNPEGEIEFIVTPTFGEGILVEGQRAGDPYLLFSDTLYVEGGIDLTHADLTVSVPEVGLNDQLTPFYECEIEGVADDTGTSVHVRGCGVDTVVAGTQVTVIPERTGVVAAAVTKPGYNVYQEMFEVVPVYGHLAGSIQDSNGNPVQGALIRGFKPDNLSQTVFAGNSGADGIFTIPDSIQAGYYLIDVMAFGFMQTDSLVFVGFGDNQVNFQLPNAPLANLSGTVTDNFSSQPLSALIRIFREEGENLILYQEDSSDATTGQFSFEVPYYQYFVTVHARGYIPDHQSIRVNSSSVTLDFPLEASIGNILVLDDNPDFRNTGEDKSSEEIVSVLTSLGFYAIAEDIEASDPSNWAQYDLIISSSGMNEDPLFSLASRQALQDYVESGGKLLIEGGEIGHDALQSPGFGQFAQTVLHVSSWSGNETGNLIKADYSHPVGSIPNLLSNVIQLSETSSASQDACVPAYGGQLVYKTEQYPGAGGVIVFDDNQDPASGQIVYFTFDWSSIQNQLLREELLENSVTYLLNPEGEGNSEISGYVALTDGNVPFNVRVSILGSSRTAFTDSSGYYKIGGVLPGNWVVRAALDGYGYKDIHNVIVGESDTLSNLNFSLSPLELLFIDNFDHGLSQWTMEGNWGIESDNPYSGENNIGDSPGGNYPNSSIFYLTTSQPVDFTDCSCSFLNFQQRYEFGPGDYGAVEVSYNGDYWQEIRRFTGIQDEWTETSLDLSGHTCHSMLYFRFKLYSDDSQTGNGWALDDIYLLGNGGFPYRKGDVNHDQNIDVVDVVSAVQIILNLSEPPDSPRFWCTDMNEDEIIDIRDVIQIVFKVLNDDGLQKAVSAAATNLSVKKLENVLQLSTDGDISGVEIKLSRGHFDKQQILNNADYFMNEHGDHLLLISLSGELLSKGETIELITDRFAEIEEIKAVSSDGSDAEVIFANLPHEFSVSQNYPNPFNPSTAVKFSIPEDSKVTVSIFDMQGREVIKLLDRDNLIAGYHQIIWNGRNQEGKVLPSGIYFCKVKASHQVKVIKMTMLK